MGQFAAVLGTAVLGTAFLGWYPKARDGNGPREVEVWHHGENV